MTVVPALHTIPPFGGYRMLTDYVQQQQQHVWVQCSIFSCTVHVHTLPYAASGVTGQSTRVAVVQQHGVEVCRPEACIHLTQLDLRDSHLLEENVGGFSKLSIVTTAKVTATQTRGGGGGNKTQVCNPHMKARHTMCCCISSAASCSWKAGPPAPHASTCCHCTSVTENQLI
jgi:hypothetical protein